MRCRHICRVACKAHCSVDIPTTYVIVKRWRGSICMFRICLKDDVATLALQAGTVQDVKVFTLPKSLLLVSILSMQRVPHSF